MDSNFIKDQYLFELERKNQLITSLNLPAGVLTVLGSLLGFFAKEYPYDLSTFLTWIFLFALCLSTISFCVAVFYLIRSLFGHTYVFIETPGALQNHYNNLLEYHRNLSDYLNSLEEYYEVESRESDYPEPEVLAERDFQEFLSQKYIAATNENTWNNDSKSERLHRANLFLIITLCSTLVCGVPFLIADLNKPERVHQIQIKNLKDLSSLKESYNESPDTHTTTDSTASSVQTPSKADSSRKSQN